MKIALVHDWLYTYAGAEKVLEQINLCFPNADIFSLIDFLPAHERSFLNGKNVKTSFIQHLPFAKTKHRQYLLLLPLAIEQFDLSGYDIVISSSYAVAKGVLTSPNQLHICYCHSPMRYAWDMQHQYLAEAGLVGGPKSWLARYVLHKLRMWDYRTANGVDAFVANSKFIARRIFKVYRRESSVIYPGVDLSRFKFESKKQEYFLTVSRLVPYKKISLIAEAFKEMPDKQLIIIGDGPERQRVEKIVSQTTNINYLGYQDEDSLISYMQNAKALIFAAEEDFGIVPIEAQACGTPVIALARGGSLETVRGLDKKNPTGVFFNEQNTASICKAVCEFLSVAESIQPKSCLANAQNFTNEAFREKFSNFVLDQYKNFEEALGA